jgi:hypothetical protein
MVEETKKEDNYNRSLACILGALLGDAMGTVLEFSSKLIN